MERNSRLILVIHAEPEQAAQIKNALEEEGFSVIVETNPADGLNLMNRHHPHLVVLGPTLPDLEPMDVLREIRIKGDTPVVFLGKEPRRESLWDNIPDAPEVKALEMGADDYIRKPVDLELEILILRVKAILRRTSRPKKIVCDGLEIDPFEHQVTRDGQLVHLTSKDWELLEVLALEPNKIMLFSEVLGKAWGSAFSGDFRYLQDRISKLRSRLGESPRDPKVIKTFEGMGYMLRGTLVEEKE